MRIALDFLLRNLENGLCNLGLVVTGCKLVPNLLPYGVVRPFFLEAMRQGLDRRSSGRRQRQLGGLEFPHNGFGGSRSVRHLGRLCGRRHFTSGSFRCALVAWMRRARPLVMQRFEWLFSSEIKTCRRNQSDT